MNMKKVSRNTVYTIVITLFLLIILFFIRINRMFYAFKEFNFHISSINELIFFILSFFQDFFFCFIIYFFSRAVLGKFVKKRTVIPASFLIVAFYIIIIIYHIFDLIYFKTSGTSISWQSILEADRIMSLWDSGMYYMTPFLIILLAVGVILICPGSFIMTNYFIKLRGMWQGKEVYIPKKILLPIIIILLFLTTQGFFVSSNTGSDINTIPIFKLISSYFSEVKSRKSAKLQKKEIEAIEWEKFDMNSRYNPISFIDKKVQLNIKKKLKSLKNRKFNIIYFISESTFAGYYPMYGGAHNAAPFLQEKCSKSLLFKNFYSTGVRSINSLISLLTGLNSYPGYKSLTYINPRIETPALSQLLKKRGYSNAVIHAGNFEFYNKLAFLNNRDFDYLVDEEYLKKVYPDAFTYSWGIDDRFMVREGLKWIDTQTANNKNFFMTFIPIFPHHPYTIPPDVELLIKEPATLFENYLNSLYFVDQVFKELYTGLEKMGLLEDTIIVFTSDHGEAFGQHVGNYGHENYIWEENVHLPGMIFNPKIIDDFYEFEGIVTHSDIFSTIVDILDLKHPPGSQGISVLDMNVGKVAFFASGTTDLDLGLRDGNHKAIYNFKNNSISLYDLTNTLIDNIDITDKEPLLAVEYKKRIIDYYKFEKKYQENFNEIIKRIEMSQKNVEQVSLLDIEPFFAVQDFYSIKKNISVEDLPLMINNVEYKKGFGVHSNCIMKFNIKGLGFTRFKGIAGKLNTFSKRENYLEMQILQNGRMAFTTGKLTVDDAPVFFDVDIKDAETLELLVLDSGDNKTCDSCAWIDPVLIK